MCRLFIYFLLFSCFLFGHELLAMEGDKDSNTSGISRKRKSSTNSNNEDEHRSKVSKKEDDGSSRPVDHLTTYQDHIDFLRQSLMEAKDSVMISTYSVSTILFNEGIDGAIKEARSRGVRIYIYYKNLKVLEHDPRLQEMLKHCDKFEQNDNHTKCVVQDKTRVAIGSFNWLSEINQTTVNRSLVVSGDLAYGVSNTFWQSMRFYQNIEHNNRKGIQRFVKKPHAFSTLAYQISPDELLYVLRTPEAHMDFVNNEVFGEAEKTIVLTSPFMRLDKLKQILSQSRIQDLEKRRVRTHLFTLDNPCNHTPLEGDQIFRYLEDMSQRYPHFSYSTHKDLHAKTIVVDNDLLCEGSFNLLSAVDSTDHNANNFEGSLALRGPIAAPFIADFFKSPLVTKAFSTSSVEKAPDIRIFSGASFGREGFCVRLGSDYIRGLRGHIHYFSTRDEAMSKAQDYIGKK